MASAKTKSGTANGAAKRSKSATPSTTANGTPATTAVDLPSEQNDLAVYGSGKPDRAIYDAEQAKIQAEIDALQAKLVRDFLSTRSNDSRCIYFVRKRVFNSLQ